VTILVNGLLELDSGKTVMAYSLTKILAREGFNVIPFKPLGAVDIWRSSWVLKEVEERRSVVSGDAVILKSAVPAELPIERINPVALILSPVDPSRLGWSQRPYQNLMLSLPRRTSLLRLTFCKREAHESYHFINEEAISRSPKSIRDLLLEVSDKLRPRASSVGDRDVEKLIQSSVAYAESCFISFRSSAEVIIVESHDDTALPLPSVLDADLVISVAPGKAGIIEGKKFSDAIRVLSSMGATLTLNTREVLNVTGVTKEINLPLLDYPLQEGYPEEVLKDVVDMVKEVIKD
jgi:predicted P-loop ATPase/GTPase